jgi:glycosyltransferase involved in cell wall biosynthesis
MPKKALQIPPLVLVGNPFSSSGRGGTVISFYYSLKTVGLDFPICDAYSRWSIVPIDPEIVIELQDKLTKSPGSRLNIYHLNAIEIDRAQAFLQHILPDNAYNILYPFWELSKFPKPWIKNINIFDEIWAPSHFIEDTFQEIYKKPIWHMPLPIKIELTAFLGRRYFNLPEDADLFLFFFDFRSYIDRKNPQAIIKVFERVLAARPMSSLRLIIKTQGVDFSEVTQKCYKDFSDMLKQSSVGDRVILINNHYNYNETRNLIRCCDCFISLHRSEGYGLGMAEAMYLGKPVIATGYSGNLDFMDQKNSCLVDYKLVPVREEQYLFAQGQVWADPDLDQAVHYVLQILDDPDFGRRLGLLASRHIRTNFSYLAMGLRYKQRLDQLLSKV